MLSAPVLKLPGTEQCTLPLGAPQPRSKATAPSCSPGESLPTPGRRAPSTHLAPQKRLGRAARAARARRARRRGGQKRPSQHLVRNPGPGPSPTLASSPRRRSRRRRREVKWGWDGAAPPLPPPPGVRSKALAGAQRRRARAATCTARQVHGAHGRPPALAPTPRLPPVQGTLGARTERVRGRATPLGARGAAATARLGWNAPPPASWKPLLALGRPPGVMPRAGIADAATAAAGRRSGERRPLRREPAGAPRLSRSRERGCHRPPRHPPHFPEPPPAPPGPGRRLCEVRPSGHTEACPEPLARACEPPALPARHDQSRRPVAPPGLCRLRLRRRPAQTPCRGRWTHHPDSWLPGTTSDRPVGVPSKRVPGATSYEPSLGNRAAQLPKPWGAQAWDLGWRCQAPGVG